MKFTPFGVELAGPAAGRMKFTGHERDEVLGLDYMVARYCGSSLGRFLSVDPLASSARPGSPQSWNRYTYTFNNPIGFIDPDGRAALIVTYPDYMVKTPVGRRRLGHSGVVLIDPDSGLTRYFEYGRYDAEEHGLVQTDTIPDVVMGEDKRPTQESMDNLMQALSKKFGQRGAVEGADFQDADFASMLEYAEGLQATTEAGQGEPYSLTGNNCATFCEDVLEAGGVDTPVTLINSPRNVIEELQEIADTVYRYEPPDEEE
ncbi:MAG: RHS repeat-associated core domain-containing protein [Acidobacteria bacterium]|nr:MAG: RHS repeat-associated core domain-containing protein [Acidobacteriota bacterium]